MSHRFTASENISIHGSSCNVLVGIMDVSYVRDVCDVSYIRHVADVRDVDHAQVVAAPVIPRSRVTTSAILAFATINIHTMFETEIKMPSRKEDAVSIPKASTRKE